MSREIAEAAYDLHTGLAGRTLPHFDNLPMVGMAVALAIHLKGIPEVALPVLEILAADELGIPVAKLDPVLHLLEEIGCVKLIERGGRIETVVPNIAVYDYLFDTIGDHAEYELTFTDREDAVVSLVAAVQTGVLERSVLAGRIAGAPGVFEDALAAATAAGIVFEAAAGGRTLVVAPQYHLDTLERLAATAAKAGAHTLRSALQKLHDNQGAPLSRLLAAGTVGEAAATPAEAALLRRLAAGGFLRTPALTAGGASEIFLFTPNPGRDRQDAGSREIQERAMALVAAVRKAQLAGDPAAAAPRRLLESFRERRFWPCTGGSRSLANTLVVLRVAQIKPETPDQLAFNRTPENGLALDLAISLVGGGAAGGDGFRIDLTGDVKFRPSLAMLGEVKAQVGQDTDGAVAAEFDRFLQALV